MNTIQYFDFGISSALILHLVGLSTSVDITAVSFGHVTNSSLGYANFSVNFTNSEFSQLNDTIKFSNVEKFNQALQTIKSAYSTDFAKIAVKLTCKTSEQHLKFIENHIPENTNRSSFIFSCFGQHVNTNDIIAVFISPEDIISNNRKLAIKLSTLRPPFTSTNTAATIKHHIMNNTSFNIKLFANDIDVFSVILHENSAKNAVINTSANFNTTYTFNIKHIKPVAPNNRYYLNIEFDRNHDFYRFIHFCELMPTSTIKTISLYNSNNDMIIDTPFEQNVKYALYNKLSSVDVNVFSDIYNINFNFSGKAISTVNSFIFADSWSLHLQNW